MRPLALAGWLGLLALQPGWYLYWAPPGVMPPGRATLLMSLPLLAVTPGLLRGRPRAYAWGCYVCLPYFIHGVVVVMTNAAARLPGSIEVACTLAFFTAAALHLRRRSR